MVTSDTVLARGLCSLTTRISCCGFWAALWGRLLWGRHQTSLNTAARFASSSQNLWLTPESPILASDRSGQTSFRTTSAAPRQVAVLTQASRKDEPPNATYRRVRPHWRSLFTFTNPQANSKPKKEQKWAADGRSHALVCCWPAKVALHQSLTLTARRWQRFRPQDANT